MPRKTPWIETSLDMPAMTNTFIPIGGVILGISDQLAIPVRYIGIGERVEDLREFDPEEFVEALFETESLRAPN